MSDAQVACASNTLGLPAAKRDALGRECSSARVVPVRVSMNGTGSLPYAGTNRIRFHGCFSADAHVERRAPSERRYRTDCIGCTPAMPPFALHLQLPSKASRYFDGSAAEPEFSFNQRANGVIRLCTCAIVQSPHASTGLLAFFDRPTFLWALWLERSFTPSNGFAAAFADACAIAGGSCCG